MKINDFQRKKEEQKKISMITCYDYPSARIVADTNLDCVLVGDSVAMAVHGFDSTIMATIEMMVMHTAAVARGLDSQFLVSDLPFLSNRLSRAQTVANVQQLMQAGAHAIKMEGADNELCETINYLVQSGIPVMGHIGLIPQSIHQLGGYKIQGKTTAQEEIMLKHAQNLQAAGCFAIVIECTKAKLAQTITQNLTIPVIGIGAGVDTDGQVLVWHDMLGLHTDITPRFVRKFHNGKEALITAINQYVDAVEKNEFPAKEHQY